MDTIGKQPHIVVRVQGEGDVDFALVPVTDSLVRIVASQVKDLRAHGTLAEAAFYDGHPVFFESREDDFGDADYALFLGRPDIDPHCFKLAGCIRHILYQKGDRWQIRWRAIVSETEFDTAGLPVTLLAATRNRYIKPGTIPMTALMDGTPLWPAYHPVRRGERVRRAMHSWDGATGEWAGVTLDGRLFRQRQLWGGSGPRPDSWQPFRLG